MITKNEIELNVGNGAETVKSVLNKNQIAHTVEEAVKFLKSKYGAQEITLPEVNRFVYGKIKMYDPVKCCDPVSVSEGNVLNENYIGTYRIERVNIGRGKPPYRYGYYDGIVMLGSSDGSHLTEFYYDIDMEDDPALKLYYELKALTIEEDD